MSGFCQKNIARELELILKYDSKGKLLEGGKKYRLHLPSCIPASDFWSIIVYDPLSHLIIQNDQSWPSVHSSNKNLIYNNDGSVDAWFGPKLIIGKEANWVKTLRGKPWYMILRLYYPLESWFAKKWQPGEIEEIQE